MSDKPHLWLHEMTWPEAERIALETSIVMVPMGSTEQHGPHLPEGTDTFVPARLAEIVAEATGVPIAPPVWFSTCEQHMGFSGTISLRPTTLILLLRDICESLGRHGFRDVVLLNGHLRGAEPTLLAAIDEIQLALPELKIWAVDLNQIAIEELREACESDVFPHAEELEASQMLVIRPDLVHLEQAVDVDGDATAGPTRGFPRGGIAQRLTADEFRQASPAGILGLATRGTALKGRAILDAQARQIVRFVDELPRRRLAERG